MREKIDCFGNFGWMTFLIFAGMQSPDMKLLMDLFSETRGVEAALRILTVLDEEFMEAWKIKDFSLKADDVSENQAAFYTFQLVIRF